MKFIIFAGGVGTRLWPLSRINSPKQFDAIWDNKSTLRLAVERLVSSFSRSDIYIQTVSDYEPLVKTQIPELPVKNIFIEPARRNVGPAVCLAMSRLQKIFKQEPIAILWADHLMKNPADFIKNLKIGGELIKKDPNRFVFLAEQPRFANNNLGWIHVGKKAGQISGVDYFRFLGWQYRPSSKECARMFNSGEYFWNSGYFVSSIDFILREYQCLSPDIFSIAEKTISAKSGRQAFEIYSQAPKISFDDCLIKKIALDSAVILKTNMGWSDPGTLYALKEALQKDGHENVTSGKVFNFNTVDSFVYNLEHKKLLTTVGLKGMVVVNTKDAIIVVPKDKVKDITELVAALKRDGYKEYL